MELLLTIIFFAVFGKFAHIYYSYRQYKKSSYYLITHNPFFGGTKGELGEYQIWKRLRYLEEHGARFLFNLYIPTGQDQTTEIDVLMIHPKGLFVIESKNYSGWIFGHAARDTWTQTLPQGRGYPARKERFHNPLRQNEAHITYLLRTLGRNVKTHSIIVFSDECEFRDVTLVTNRHQVIQLAMLRLTVEELFMDQLDTALTATDIDNIYKQLYPYTQVSDDVKRRHIEAAELYSPAQERQIGTLYQKPSFIERRANRMARRLRKRIFRF